MTVSLRVPKPFRFGDTTRPARRHHLQDCYIRCPQQRSRSSADMYNRTGLPPETAPILLRLMDMINLIFRQFIREEFIRHIVKPISRVSRWTEGSECARTESDRCAVAGPHPSLPTKIRPTSENSGHSLAPRTRCLGRVICWMRCDPLPDPGSETEGSSWRLRRRRSPLWLIGSYARSGLKKNEVGSR